MTEKTGALIEMGQRWTVLLQFATMWVAVRHIEEQ
jgi:hypothetical protein